MIRFDVSALLVMTAVAACAEPVGEDVYATTTQALEDNCNSDICPKNSPVVATYPILDLSVIPGQLNAQDFMITRFLIRGQPHLLRVARGRISGSAITGTVTGIDLKGAELWLWRRGVEYVLKIADVKYVRMWARLSPTQPPPEIEVYEIEWADVIDRVPKDQWRNICASAMRPGGSVELNGIPNDVTVVFEGERIDPKLKTIYDFDSRWFNLGCAGHMLMKMVLMGHVAAAPAGYTTTMDHRRAAMKMFAGDYCGTGYSFTIPGVPLLWKDNKGWFDFSLPTGPFEATWTPFGAACLTVPRVMTHWNDADLHDEFVRRWSNGIIPEIQARCPGLLSIPCSNPPPIGFPFVTANTL